MNTKLGILAGLALVTFTGIFTAMLALGVISPLGVQGADHPIDDSAQAVGFQPAMVTDVSVTSTTQDPGDVSGYRFRFTTPDALTANEDTITVHFDKDFMYPPEVLSRSNVTVSAMVSSGSATTDASGPGATGDYGPPSDATREILTSGKHGLSDSAALNNVEYTFQVPDMNGDKEGSPGIAAGATVTVTVSPGAGISNPTEAGSKGPIGVFTSRQPVMDTSLRITVNRTLQLSDYDTHRGKAITVIGKGFQDGTTAHIFLDNANGMRQELVSEHVASDDTFLATFIVTVPPFVPGKGNMIYAEDGNQPPFTAGPVEFEVEGLLTVSPASAAVGDEVDITLVDWPDGPIPAGAVTIAGVAQRVIGSPSVTGNSASFRIEIGTGTPSGTNEIKVTANGESDRVWITILGAILETSPATAVPNQAVTVTGRGFTGDGTINAAGDGSEVTLGGDGKALTRSAGGFRNFNNGEAVTVDSGGSWSATIIVPITTATTLPGTDWLEVMDSGGRSGSADITFPPRTLTIEPAGARPGEEAALTGAGFPASNTRAKEQNTPPIEVYYDDGLVGTAIPDGDGNITLSFRVPLDAAIPSTNRVEARYMIPGAPSGSAPVKAHTNHEVPGARIRLSMDEGKPGDSLTITGDGFKAFALVEYVRIGGVDVTPAPRPDTDLDGEFTVTILVPDLAEGAHSVEVQAGGVTASANFMVLDFGTAAGDRAALAALYNATGGMNWTNNTNWLTGASLDQWYGVETDANGRVILLYLESNRLSGKIPAELGNLTMLAVLYLGGNQLTGCVPAGLRNVALNDFAELGLSFCVSKGVAGDRAALVALYKAMDGANWANNTGWLTDAPLDQWYGVMTDTSGRVVFLFLGSNQLTGQIPLELGDLTNLEALALMENQLSGPIPAELGRLTKLFLLDLSFNQISGDIPAELGSLSNLETLGLSFIQLTGQIPSELGSLTNLQFLGLSNNQLSGEIPAELGKLKSLEALFLSHNRLSGEIPMELGSLTNLGELFLNDNRLSGEIPTELGSLTNLEYLYVGSNRLTGCAPANLRGVASHDLAELGLPFCDMLDGSPVVVIRFASAAGTPVRLGSPVSLEATFSEPVSGFALEDVSVANGVAGNFAGSGAVYTFGVTPNAIGEVTVNIAAGAAEDADGGGNWAARLPLGFPYDDDGDGAISKSEVITAINDYLFGNRSIAKSHLIYLVNLYLFGGTP